jgi:hypothetical protein
LSKQFGTKSSAIVRIFLAHRATVSKTIVLFLKHKKSYIKVTVGGHLFHPNVFGVRT